MYTMLPFNHMSRTFNDLFDEMERSMFPAQPSGRLPAFRTDIKDQGDHYLLEADLPGFRKEDIDLHLEDNVLTITAKHQETAENKQDGKYICRERRVGMFRPVQSGFELAEPGAFKARYNEIIARHARRVGR